VGFENRANKRPNEHNLLTAGAIDTSKETALEIKIENTSRESNSITFNYSLNYFPVVSSETSEASKQIPDDDSFSAKSPWIMTDSMPVEQKFGFGAFNNNCFKPISFSLDLP
jgi:hypothetical protein